MATNVLEGSLGTAHFCSDLLRSWADGKIYYNLTFWGGEYQKWTEKWTVTSPYVEIELSGIVCHPGLWLQWFKKLGDVEYEWAKIIFEVVFKKYESESAAPLNNNSLPQTSAPNNDDDFLMPLAYVPPPDDVDANSPLDTPASSEFECYTILCQNMVTQQDHMDNLLPWWKVSTFGYILIVMGFNMKLSLCQAHAHKFCCNILGYWIWSIATRCASRSRPGVSHNIRHVLCTDQ